MKITFTAVRAARLEKLVREKLPYLRRALVQKLFRKKEVKVGGVHKPAENQVELRAKIEVFLPDPRKYFFALTGCEIVHEDANVIAFDKRSGLTTQEGVGTHGDTLHMAAQNLLKLHLVVVHRLDRETSGLIIFAKNQAMARRLEDEFRGRRVEKTYLAVVEGNVKLATGVIEKSLQKVGKKMELAKGGGLTAKTSWKVLKKLPGKTLLELKIPTGRMHQIRVHLASIGHPVVGDDLYGRSLKTGRMLLHAAELKILDYDFKSKVPEEFGFVQPPAQ